MAAMMLMEEGRGRVRQRRVVFVQQNGPNNQPKSHVKCSNPLEVVADKLLLFHEAQLAVNTILVSIVRADGDPKRQVCRMG